MSNNVKRLSWFKMRNSGNGSASLDIFGDIGGYGVNFPMFARQLEQLGLGAGDTLNIRINSDGGDVYQGFAIYQALALHPATKIVTVMGLAASMASVIFMAGDKRIMPANATLMIHNPVGQIIGESEEIIAFGEGVGDMKKNIAAAYSDQSGGKLTVAQAIKLMDRQSWVGADKALALGLATAVMPSVKIAAKFDLSRYPNAPTNIDASFTRKENAMKTRNSNNRRNAADDFDFEGDAGVSAETRTAVRDELLKQHSDITAVCKLAGKPELAADFLQEDLSLAEVVAELDELRAEAAKGNGKGKTNANANASGNRRETARDNRNARNARDSRNANGGDVEISARSAVNTSGGDSVVPEINPTKIWDKWNAAGTKAA